MAITPETFDAARVRRTLEGLGVSFEGAARVSPFVWCPTCKVDLFTVDRFTPQPAHAMRCNECGNPPEELPGNWLLGEAGPMRVKVLW